MCRWVREVTPSIEGKRTEQAQLGGDDAKPEERRYDTMMAEYWRRGLCDDKQIEDERRLTMLTRR